MKKRLISLTLMVLLTSALALNAFAALDAENASDFGSSKIEITIRGNGDVKMNSGKGYGASSDAQYAKIEELVEKANQEIEKLIAQAQETDKDDISQLLRQVDQIVEQVIKKAAAYGYEIECTYTAYEIDGQITEIDPLRVVNRR